MCLPIFLPMVTLTVDVVLKGDRQDKVPDMLVVDSEYSRFTAIQGSKQKGELNQAGWSLRVHPFTSDMKYE
jgi:hypothetical protein